MRVKWYVYVCILVYYAGVANAVLFIAVG